jgi:hypothetical protein
MKATIEFNLPDDQLEFDLAVNSGKWYSVAWDLNQYIRSQTKHAPEDMSDDTFNTFVLVRNKIHELLNDNKLEL